MFVSIATSLTSDLSLSWAVTARLIYNLQDSPAPSIVYMFLNIFGVEYLMLLLQWAV